MTSKFIGGGHKKRYRVIDFKRNRYDDIATVKSIRVLTGSAHSID